MNNLVICLLAIIAIMMPSSLGGVTQPRMIVNITMALLPLYGYLLLKQKKVDPVNLFIAIGFGVLLTSLTVLSPYPTYRYGNGLMFIVLFALCLLNNDKNPLNLKTYTRTLFILNVFLSFLAFCIILDIPLGIDFISENYQAFYPELIPNMLFQSKPVTVFGTHSIAGFYNFLFFVTNLALYKYTKHLWYLLFASFYMVFLFWLQSSTSLVFFLISFIALQFELYKAQRFLFLLTLTIELFALILAYQMVGDVVDQTLTHLFSEGNGLGGRYSEGGNLANNLEYVMNNPLGGIGFSYTTNFMFADSGYLEYALRGSILATLGVVISFSRYIFRNITTYYRYLFLFAYLAFEVGFSNMIYYRTFGITLFLIALFNQLQRHEQSKPNTKALKI